MSMSRGGAPRVPIGPWIATVVGFGWVLAGPAWAERTPEPGVLDARVRSVPYEADQVVRLTGQVGYALELVFEPGERFAGLASGDLTGVDFTAEGEHLFLKPQAAGVATNLTVLTDRRVYRFSYVIVGCAGACMSAADGRSRKTRSPLHINADSSADSRELRDAVLWSVRFEYPAKPGLEDRAPVQPVNDRYQFCGARALRPQHVFDDGVRTTIEFGVHQELPAVFVRNADGSESLVNTTTVASGVVVHRVVEHLILRRGALTACLWNRAAHRSPADRSSDDGSWAADERVEGVAGKEAPPAGPGSPAAGVGGE